jgi:hypothetical protein
VPFKSQYVLDTQHPLGIRISSHTFVYQAEPLTKAFWTSIEAINNSEAMEQTASTPQNPL